MSNGDTDLLSIKNKTCLLIKFYLFFLPAQDWAPGQVSGAVAAPEETELKLPGPQREQVPTIRIQHSLHSHGVTPQLTPSHLGLHYWSRGQPGSHWEKTETSHVRNASM